MKKVELLAPAGDMEKLMFAVAYGADAVYLSGENFGLRAAAGNFTNEEIMEAVTYCHNKNIKVYVTVNIFAKNRDFENLSDYIIFLKNASVDALLVSDPGIFLLCKDIAPELPIHISTQANTTNFMAVNFWHKLGADRVVLARELNIQEISEIVEKGHCEIEVFVHGALCISYSGRCHLSNYLTSRDANKGECTHPCRWRYGLVEEKRPDEMFIIEDEQSKMGSYIFNSKDLCLIKYLPELIEAGVNSLKIEGRMKSIYYLSITVASYRKALDMLYMENNYEIDNNLLQELSNVSNRGFCTGFLLGNPDKEDYNLVNSAYIKNYDFIGVIKKYDSKLNVMLIEQRNRFFKYDKVEIVTPSMEIFDIIIDNIIDMDGNEIDSAPHPQQLLYIPCSFPVTEYCILRKKIN